MEEKVIGGRRLIETPRKTFCPVIMLFWLAIYASQNLQKISLRIINLQTHYKRINCLKVFINLEVASNITTVLFSVDIYGGLNFSDS